MDTEEKNTGASRHFPTFVKMDRDVTVSILALVIVLLPGILAKVVTIQADATELPVFLSATFQTTTLLISFVLSLYAMVRAAVGSSARMIALLTLIVCIARFILVG